MSAIVDNPEMAALRVDLADLRRRVVAMERGAIQPSKMLARVVPAVAAEFEVPAHMILSDMRRSDVVLARHVVTVLMLRLTGWSMSRLGRSMGRDHTSIMHASRRVAEIITCCPDFADRLDRLAAALNVPLTPSQETL